ncbi:putative protein involved in capsular polysaccharide biosynthesis [Indibacter alkaliphilus LW1]|uniref:Polysaccharide chain length determinant N-terminal domain-containing protein n=1 Tax=Indibacter alkaliphilus (strain CCUG 57479 / KCTC 22604 / LW1) TaxID=1189612 RepID=S2D9W0_INDAL|nr:Wzz/FepE/Etk N-terminal domain-containing protein [Indibacter alkaliphilus]EOZ95679.1 putative protein involved in capsular polysaccharide biosynthesis [Indibacter alkaliphilus LW1]
MEKTERKTSLAELFGHLKANQKLIIKCFVVIAVLATVIYLGTPTEYKVEVKVLPEMANQDPNNMLRQLSGGAAGGLLAGGLGARQNNDFIDPVLYNEIMTSSPFLFGLIEDSYWHSELGKISLRDYYDDHKRDDIFTNLKKYTIQLHRQFRERPVRIDSSKARGDFDEKGVIQSMDQVIINDIKDKFSVSYKPNLGTVSLSVSFYDPMMAKEMAEKSTEAIIDFLIEYRSQKATQNLNFVQKRFNEAQANFFKTQEALAKFRDSNFNVQSAAVKVREERLQAEFNQASGIFNNLAQQLELAKVKVQEDTPVFNIIEPALLPRSSHKPNLLLFIAGVIFVGIVVSFSAVYFKVVILGIDE